MPRNVYWELYYHIVWRTKDSVPYISESMASRVYDYLTYRALQTPGVIVHALGGIEDHVHMAASLPPTIEISKWIGDLKGATSHEMNNTRSMPLAWQTGYGIVSFGRKDLPWVLQYIQNQREHHARGQTEDRLEQIMLPE
jgi:putative transposase